jgi:hypothetical protein
MTLFKRLLTFDLASVGNTIAPPMSLINLRRVGTHFDPASHLRSF